MKNKSLQSIKAIFALIKDRLGSGQALLVAVLLLATMTTVKANPVDAERARLVAKTFLTNNGARSTGLTDITAEVGFDNVYVFTTANSFVILAADDCERPVLGYSLNGGFDLENMPENKAAWIQEYSDGIRYAIDHQMRASTEVLQLWNDLAAGRPDAGRAVTVVSPLVQTQWNQGNPYNLLCPSSSVTGCVATAMAQVMKYWNYPEHGIGSHSYVHYNYGELSADFQSTTYDWTNMLNSYSGSSTQTQKMAVATLMYHCGVSVDMDYSPSGSGAVTAQVADALKTYFNYSTQTQHHSRSEYDDDTWVAMLKADLDLNRPIQYHGSGSGGGHSFVFDGYNSSNYFHVNWGWGGYCDEYYQVSNLNPGPGGIGSGSNGIYNDYQGAIFHAHPSECTASSPSNLTYTQNGRYITLNWSTASGAASYNVYRNNNFVTNVTTNTYTDTAPFGSSEYYVRSVDAAGEMSLSSNAVTVSVDYPVPVVDDLAANVTGNNIGLTWTAPDWCYPETPTATLNYGEGSVYYSWTYTYYAHRYLASDLAAYAGKAVYKVSTYVQYPGDYTVYVYTNSNGNQPLASALAVTKTLHSSSSNAWFDFDFDEPIILSGTTDLWVVMNQQNTGASYPTPSFNLSSHNTNAFYAGSSPTSLYDGNSSYNCAWFINTFLTDGEYTYNLYRNGSCIANNVSSTSYDDNNLASGSYEYYVKTNYYAGESAASNHVTAQIGAGNYLPITATANPTAGGTITGTGSYLQGSTCTLTATPNTGYHFVNWTKNGTVVSTNTTYSFTVTEAASFVANFEINSYDITVSANPAVGGTVTGGGTFNYGASCTLTATANTDYNFVNWTKNGTEVSTNATYSFTVTEAAVYVANFEEEVIGDYVYIGDGGTTTNSYLPSYTMYNYSFTQQIYTVDEIGMAGTINSIAFYNGGSEKTRSLTFYLAHTTKTAFESTTDWVTVTAANQVYSGSVTMVADNWTTITFDTPFAYDGVNNLVLITDDNTGNWSSGMSCRVFAANGNQAIRVYSDGTNYDPTAPTSYTGALLNVKNQLRLGITPNSGEGLTVHDGTATNGYVPVYGFYADAYLKSEAVYPAAELSSMAGADINSIKYYSSNTNVSWDGTSFQVFMKEVSSTTINAFAGTDGATIVYEGALSIDGNGEMLVNFTTPYHYNGGNLLIGVYNTASGNYVTSNWYGEAVEGASVQGYNYSSLSSVSPTQRNFLPKTTFSYSGGVAPEVNLAVNPDPIDLGPRPNGAWMRPYTFSLENVGIDVDIYNIQVTDDYYTLQLGNVEFPFTLESGQSVGLGLDWGEDNGSMDASLVVTHAEGQTSFDVTALAYDPVAGDVWEDPIDVTEFPFTETITPATAPYYNNYVMPLPEIEDGNDVVYRLTFDNDTYLNAAVTSGENGKVALYPEGFKGLGGPDENNYYTNPMSTFTGTPYEVQIGEGTSTTGYFPFYTLYNYSIAESLFLASELYDAGVTTAPMTSLSWYATNAPGYAQQGITIWMANVNDEALATTSHVVTNMVKVYTGAMTPEIGWNEFVFNEGTFAWDGSSNILIYCQRNNGSWNSTVYWQATSDLPFTGMSYRYQDSGAYDPTVAQTMTTSNTRPNIIMKGGNREGGNRGNRDIVEIGDGTGTTYYFPIDNYFNYSCTEQIYTADEIGTAGTINSISFYYNYGTAYTSNNVTMYMKNVNRSVFASSTDYEPLAAEDIVWTGSIAPTAAGWYTFNLDTPFQYDGTSNLLVAFYDGTSGYPGTSYTWRQTTSPGSANMALRYYSDSYNPDPYNLGDFGGSKVMYTYRSNIQLDITPSDIIGPEITDMTVVPGTYYLVASSTSDEFTVEINTSDVPCPEEPTLVYPEDNSSSMDPARVTLKWQLDNHATEYALRVGTDINNLETIVDWTRDLAQVYTLRDLDYNTTYFWQVLQRNDDCPEGVEGPVWNFTTWLLEPNNLYSVNGSGILEGETLQLAWSPMAYDNNFVFYEVYQNGVLIGSSTEPYFEVEGLTYNTNWYLFNVTAVYYSGGIYMSSWFSNTAYVGVNGLGTMEGYVYEQDGITGIPHATVTAFGYDYFGTYRTNYFYTDENGYYIGQMPTGYGYSAFANATGYQEGYYDGGFDVEYITTTSGINIILDEQFVGPTGVTAQYYPDPNDLESSSVQVTWDDNLWHTYCEYEWQAAWVTYSGNTTWGYNYPTEVLVPYVGYTLNKVALYSDTWPAVGGNYTCNVYTGGETPAEGTLVSSITVDVPQNLGRWVTYPLTTPVSVTNGTSIWVIWTANTSLGGYPAGCCYNDNSNENGDWWYNFDENLWQHLAEVEGYPGLCWTMRNHFSDSEGRSVVLGTPNYQRPAQPNKANIADNAPKAAVNNGEMASCVHANVPRIPLKNHEQDRSLQYYRVYRTDYFNYGPFTVDNTVLIADNVTDYSVIDQTFGYLPMGTYKYGVSCVYEGNRESRISWMQQKYEVEECQKMLSKMGHNRDSFYYDFENDLQGWTSIDADGDGYGWEHSSAPVSYFAEGVSLAGTGHDASEAFALSGSYSNVNGALVPDNYFVSPLISFGGSISFWACAQDASYAAEHFGVAISTNSNNNPSDFVTIQEWTMTAKGTGAKTTATRSGNRSQGAWYQYTVDLSAYEGLSGYVAFRHFNCTDEFLLDIDDIEIIGEAAQPIQLERESEIAWSNPMDKDMYLYDAVDITVTLNSGDSPEDVYVELYQSSEQQQVNPLNNTLWFYMDETGYHAWDLFRKGTYWVYIWKDGYQYIYDEVTIDSETHLVYELEEIMEGVTDLYVSRTGWAMWNGLGNDAPELTNTHYGATFFEDFENGMPEDWMTIDNGNPQGYGWQLGSTKFGNYGYGHEGSNDLMISQSYDNNYGIVYPDNYLITPQVTLGGTFSFWACAQDVNWGAEHFGVAVSTTGVEAGDFTMLNEWTIGAKSRGAETNVTRSGSRAQSTWELYTVDLSAYAGQTGYIAIRHFNCSDQFYLNVDDVEFRNGILDRHYETIQLTLTDTDDNVLYIGTTDNDYMQLPTENLTEGEVYKLSVVQTYSSGLTSVEASCRWVYQPCDLFEGASDFSSVIDNDGVTLSWTYPVVNDTNSKHVSNGKGNRDAWDLLYSFNAAEAGHYGVVTDGTYIYTSNWGYSSATHNFYKYDMQGNMIEGFEIEGCGNLRGMTYDGQYVYGVSNSSTVYCVDLNNHTLVSTFTSAYGNMRGITYDSARDGFWVIGNWSGNLTFIDRTGAIQFTGPEPTSASDLAYYMDEDGVEHVFYFNNGDNGVYDYNITTNTLGSSVFNFNNLSGVTGTSGGCHVAEFDGKIAFFGDIQQDPNLIGIYELHEAGSQEPGPVGAPYAAAIFRDGEWIGYTVDPVFTDTEGTADNVYELRIVYGGTKQCPYNNAYFTMSCPQTVEVASEITQVSDLLQGWNWWSAYINMDGYNSLAMLEEALGTNAMQIKSQSDFAQYLDIPGYGGYWYGTLDTILSNKKTYLIQNSTSCQIELTGMPVSPADHPITILPGWNWIGFPSSTAISFAEAFAGFTPTDGDQVKSQSGFSQYMFVPGYGGVWYGGLETENLTPGMGLMYKSMNTGNATLVYPTVGRSVENVSYVEKHWTNDVHAYPSNMTLMAVVELDDVELASDNYELAAFADGECRGSAKLTYVEPLNRYFAFLTIAGEEAADLTFGLYNHTTGEENFESSDVIVYTTDASVGSFNTPMVVRFRGTTGLNDLESSLHVYPNPVARGQQFSITLPVGSEVRVETVNALGAIVSSVTSTKAPASFFAPNTSGVYTLRITVDGKGTYCRKLVVE